MGSNHKSTTKKTLLKDVLQIAREGVIYLEFEAEYLKYQIDKINAGATKLISDSILDDLNEELKKTIDKHAIAVDRLLFFKNKRDAEASKIIVNKYPNKLIVKKE